MNTHDQDRAIEQEIVEKNLVARRVTLDDINNLMSQVVYCSDIRPNGSTTILVNAFLRGNFYLASGMSACVSLENYNQELGLKIATQKAQDAARNKLWELEGYALHREMNQSN